MKPWKQCLQCQLDEADGHWLLILAAISQDKGCAAGSWLLGSHQTSWIDTYTGAVIISLVVVSLLVMCYAFFLDVGYSMALPTHRRGNQLIFSAMTKKQELRHWPISLSLLNQITNPWRELLSHGPT